MSQAQDLLEMAYRLFNVRDIDAILLLMQPDVDWPNGMEGGRVHGREGVREYWTRQWKMVDPHVAPVSFTLLADGRVDVEVQQVVRDLTGQELLNQRIEHVYTIEDGLIRKMEIGRVLGSRLEA